MKMAPLGQTLSNTVDLVHGILQAKILEWVAFVLQGIFWTQRLNPGLPNCK